MPIQLLRRFSNAYTIITILLLSIFSISANFLSYTSVIIHINNQLDYLLKTILLLVSQYPSLANFLSYISVIIHINNQLDHLLERIRQNFKSKIFERLLRFSSSQFLVSLLIFYPTHQSSYISIINQIIYQKRYDRIPN